MADKKISQLTALSAANLAPSTDVLAIVDTSATETKKILAQDLINGVLNVASAVGIGTASPSYRLDVSRPSYGVTARFFTEDGTNNPRLVIYGSASGTTIQNTFSATAANLMFAVGGAEGAGTEVGRFDGNGNFGIGTTTINYRAVADCNNAGNNDNGFAVRNANSSAYGGSYNFEHAVTSGNSPVRASYISSEGGSGNSFMRFATTVSGTLAERMRLDSSGNLTVKGYYIIDDTGTGIVSAQGSGSSVLTLNGRNFITFTTGGTPTGGTERGRFTAGGDFLVGKTSSDLSAVGVELRSGNGDSYFTVNDGANVLALNRQTADGDLIRFFQGSTSQEGSISVSGATVSYNAFAGSHWSQLHDGSRPDILRGTVMESINELCAWPGEDNERLPKCKISNTAGSNKVYGVFMTWEPNWDTTNDMLITSVGAFICRINASVTVQEGDLLESNGDGTARVQADDIIRSSTIGKVTSTVKTHEYDDGSYCVPTVLYCG